jgi:hypothetical protein
MKNCPWKTGIRTNWRFSQAVNGGYLLMDNELLSKLAYELGLDKEEISSQERDYNEIIHSKIKTRYLSHLIATVEDLISEKKAKQFIQPA